MQNRPLRIRSDWDRQIAESVMVHDEYGLADLFDAGAQISWALDVGSHIGSFAVHVKRFWPDAHVICIEPDPTAEPYWRYNTAPYSNVMWNPCAVAPVGGPAEVRLFHSADGNAAANFTAEVVEQFTALPTARNFDVVPAMDIVALLARYDSPPLDLVKLDCEGVEAHVLEDMQRAGYLERVGYLCGEWHYFESIERLEQALAETHRTTIFRDSHPWGAFRAWRAN